jgi:hypothetical protein
MLLSILKTFLPQNSFFSASSCASSFTNTDVMRFSKRCLVFKGYFKQLFRDSSSQQLYIFTINNKAPPPSSKPFPLLPQFRRAQSWRTDCSGGVRGNKSPDFVFGVKNREIAQVSKYIQ